VVVLVVLVLLAVPVLITQATVAPNWKDAYENMHDRTKVLEQTNRQYQLVAQLEQARARQAQQLADQTDADRLREVARLTEQVQQKDAKIRELSQQLNDIGAQLTQISLTLKKQVARNEQLAADLDASRKKTLRLDEQIRQLDEQLAERDIDIGRLERTVQFMRDSLGEKERQIEDLREKLRKAGPAVAEGPDEGVGVVERPVPGEGPKIRGTIVAVDEDVASINIGSAQDVAKDMEFIVYRGDEFVCFLRIQQVGTNVAAGVVAEKRLTPMQGDKVMARQVQP
jgi:hypothetical protein